MEHKGGQRDTQFTGVAEVGGPTNAEDEDRQQRGQRQQRHVISVVLVKEHENGLLPRYDVPLQSGPEWDGGGAGHSLEKGKQQVEQQAGEAA